MKKKMIYYYTYKITLLKGSLAGFYYLGKHKTKNLNDKYAGSGRKIKDYFKHYDKIDGITYVKSVLQFYNNENELNKAEEILIGDKWKTDPLCLNCIPGGKGEGRNKGYKHSIETKKKISDNHKGIKFSDEHKKNLSIAAKNRNPHKHSEETKQKMRISALNRKPLSDEAKNKISKANKGRIPWNKRLINIYNNNYDTNGNNTVS